MVRHSLVLAGLTIASGTAARIGIMALATFELLGPTMATMDESPAIVVAFWAPFWGSWTPLMASSKGLYWIVKPLMV